MWRPGAPAPASAEAGGGGAGNRKQGAGGMRSTGQKKKKKKKIVAARERDFDKATRNEGRKGGSAARAQKKAQLSSNLMQMKFMRRGAEEEGADEGALRVVGKGARQIQRQRENRMGKGNAGGESSASAATAAAVGRDAVARGSAEAARRMCTARLECADGQARELRCTTQQRSMWSQVPGRRSFRKFNKHVEEVYRRETNVLRRRQRGERDDRAEDEEDSDSDSNSDSDDEKGTGQHQSDAESEASVQEVVVEHKATPRRKRRRKNPRTV